MATRDVRSVHVYTFGLGFQMSGGKLAPWQQRTVVAEAVAVFIMIIKSSITECHWAGPSYLSEQRRQILLFTHFIEE